MRHAWVSRVGMVTLVGVLVLSAGIVLLADSAGAAPPTKPSGTAPSTPTQNWDTVLPADQRFTVLAAFNNAAVRDNETGLVWEQSGGASAGTWDQARTDCAMKNVGGRKAWRLPSLPELMSLVDPNAAGAPPFFPPGHPFTPIQLSDRYWSATTNAGAPTSAFSVGFFDGGISGSGKTESRYVWCVRGGMNADAY